MRVRVGKMTHVVATEARALGKELAEADRAIEQRPRHRERPAGVRIQAAVRKHQLRSDGAGVWTCEQEVGHLADGPRVDGHLAAEQEDKTTLAALEAQVGRPAVAN